jgi:hypothetical protein
VIFLTSNEKHVDETTLPFVLAEEYRQALEEKVREYEKRYAEQAVYPGTDPANLLDTRCKIIAGKMALEWDESGEAKKVTFDGYKQRLAECLSSAEKALANMQLRQGSHERIDDTAFRVIRDYASTGGEGVDPTTGTGFGVGKHG